MSFADLLIHEVAIAAGDPAKIVASGPEYAAVLAHHTSPAEAGRLFTNAHPKLAVYSHIVSIGFPSAGLPEPTAADIVAQTRQTYHGPLVVGEDLMTFAVSETSVAIGQ